MSIEKPKFIYDLPLVPFDSFNNDPLISLADSLDPEKLSVASTTTNKIFWQKIIIDSQFFDKSEDEVCQKLSSLFKHAYLHFYTGSQKDWKRSIEQGWKPYMMAPMVTKSEPISLETKIPRYYISIDDNLFHNVNPHVQYVWLDGYDSTLNYLIGNKWLENRVVISNTNLKYAIFDLDRFAEEWSQCSELPELSEHQKKQLDTNLPTGNDLYCLSPAINGIIRNTACATTRYALYRVQFLFNAFAKLVAIQTEPGFRCGIKGKMGLISGFSWSLARENASNRVHVTEVTGV